MDNTDNILEEVVDELMQLGEEKFFNTIMLLKLVSARANEMNQEIVDLRQQVSSARFISAAMSATKESLSRSIIDGRTWKNKYNALADKFDARSQTLEILKRKNAELEQSLESEREIRYTYQDNSGKLFEKNQELQSTIAAMRNELEKFKFIIERYLLPRCTTCKIKNKCDNNTICHMKDVKHALSNTARADNLAWRERAEELLKKMEWASDDGEHCPCCGKYKGNWFPNGGKGHSVDCELASLIGVESNAK